MLQILRKWDGDRAVRIATKVDVEHLRKVYPAGTEVVLVKMEDINAPPAGTKGKVIFVDDIATIHVEWENGSRLGVIFGEDIITKTS